MVKGGKRFGFAALVVVGDQKAELASAKEKLRKFQKHSKLPNKLRERQ